MSFLQTFLYVFNTPTTFSLCCNPLIHVSFCSFYANFSKDPVTLRWKLGDRCILSALMCELHAEKPCTGTYFAPKLCLIVWSSRVADKPLFQPTRAPRQLPLHPPNKSIQRRITKGITDRIKWSLNFWWLHWDDWSHITERHPSPPPGV